MIVDIRRTMEKILEDTPITPQIFLENVMTVADGSRQASLAHLDMLNIRRVQQASSFREVKESYTRMKSRVLDLTGVQMTMLPDPSLMLIHRGDPSFPRILFYRTPEAAEKIALIKQKYQGLSRSLLAGILNVVEYFSCLEEEGTLIGIPSCCVKSFVNTRRRALVTQILDGKKEILIQQALRKLAPNLVDVGNLPREVLDLFWAYEIYPCSLDCQQSRGVGQRIVSSIGDEQVRRAYRDIVMVNNAKKVHSPELLTGKIDTDTIRAANYDIFNRDILAALKP